MDKFSLASAAAMGRDALYELAALKPEEESLYRAAAERLDEYVLKCAPKKKS